MATETKAPTIQALHESLKDDPMALIMGPAIQAGLSLAARLARDHPAFWDTFRVDLLNAGSGIDGLNQAEEEVLADILKRYQTLTEGKDE